MARPLLMGNGQIRNTILTLMGLIPMARSIWMRNLDAIIPLSSPLEEKML